MSIVSNSMDPDDARQSFVFNFVASSGVEWGTTSIAGGHQYAAPRQASMSISIDDGQVYRSIDYNGLHISHS